MFDLQQTAGTLEHSNEVRLIVTHAPAEEQMLPEQSGNLPETESQVSPPIVHNAPITTEGPTEPAVPEEEHLDLHLEQQESGEGCEEEQVETRDTNESNSISSEIVSENDANKEEKDDESDEDITSESYESASESEGSPGEIPTGNTTLSHSDDLTEAELRWAVFSNKDQLCNG